MLQTPAAAGASPQKRRIAPSRANAEKNADASAEPMSAQDASLPTDAHEREPAAKQPPDAAQGFERTGSAARAAVMGISRFRRAASQVLKRASAGKDGDAGQPQQDSLQADTKDTGFFGFRCVTWRRT